MFWPSAKYGKVASHLAVLKLERGQIMSTLSEQRRSVVSVATAMVLALVSALPMVARASQTHQEPVSAASIGLHEPTAQQIQDTIDRVRAQGLAIRAIGHSVRQSQTVLVNGQRIVVRDVPGVEFAVGPIDGTAVDPKLSADTPATVAVRQLRSRIEPMRLRNGHASAESTYNASWTDNSANGDAGGHPSFYFTIHYTVSCINTNCTDYLNYVNRRASAPTLCCTATLQTLQQSFSCAGIGGGGGVGWYGVAAGGWTSDPTQVTTDTTFNGSTCTQRNFTFYLRGSWSLSGRNFTSYFYDANEGQSPTPVTI